uniref:Capsular polysaccharide synthesis protein n=1 Tax=Megaviridae environmental sample TaxID=1737588 RepID=A0A5J6VJR2_9VIRU|nr:MAG: capsular polysaccharide synthesis protein [Megaviridae environmental sample]
MLSKLINKVYVINLKSCSDRKKHIEQEFQRLKINNYEIFKATDKDSKHVQDMMKTDFVKSFPPCFRCNQNKCGCSNNVLIKHQIGNWCSFINVMNDIIKNDYKDLIMICEDDIKFTDDGMNILNKMITRDNLRKYNISFEKPILIRAEQRGSFPPLNNLKLTKNIKMSNACFICNKYYADSFIKNLKIIDTTSDIYIQRNILKYDNNIQHFTIEPSPVYQLSDGKFKKFKSEIHPKGIDEEDKIRAQNHIKKVEYKEFLCIGHPRCGTTSMSYYLNQMGYDVGHENIDKNGVSSWMLAVKDKNYPWGNITDKSKYYFKNIIHVVRNPFDAIPSIILENKYSPDNKSYKFKKKHINRIFNKSLPDIDFRNISLLDEIELAIKTFIYWNKICEKCNPETICKIEDISSLQKFNTKNIILNTSKKNANKKYGGKKYEKPHISADMYQNINNNLKKELQIFCKKYNYNYLLEQNDINHALFIHVGKSAGSSYREILKLKKENIVHLKKPTPEQLDNANLIIIPIRNPIERFISAFNYVYKIINYDISNLNKNSDLNNTIAPYHIKHKIIRGFAYNKNYNNLVNYFETPNKLGEALSNPNLKKKALELMTNPTEHIFKSLGFYTNNGELIKKYHKKIFLICNNNDFINLLQKFNINKPIEIPKIKQNSNSNKYLSFLAKNNIYEFYKNTDYNTLNLMVKYNLLKKNIFNNYIKYLNHKKKLFVFWNKGWENVPEIIELCIKSWKNIHKDFEIVQLDDNNLNNYIDIEEYIPKYKNKQISIQAKSDIIRICLLHKYGGLWIDATIYFNKKIDNKIFEKGFFSLDNKLPPLRYISSFFLYSEKNNYIINRWFDKTIEYWNKNNKAHHYYWFHFLFKELYEKDSKVKSLYDNIPKIKVDDVVSLIGPKEKLIDEKLYDQKKDIIDNPPFIFKLNWKIKKINYNKNTPITYLIKKFDFNLVDFQDNYKLENHENENIFIINNDFKMYVPPSKTDGIFISLRQKKTWEPNVTKGMLYKFIKKKIDTFIDIGANIGYYTLLFASKNIKTYSFEPNLENYNILTKNLKINNFNSSIIYNLGLSESIGELEFYYRKEKSGHGTFNKNIIKQQNLKLCKKIKVDKLDNINIQGENIMVKIDIEGYELNAIKGMLKLLESTKIKVFCIEISRKFYGIDIEKTIINLLKKYFTKLYIVQLNTLFIEIPHIHQYDLICS